jgi:hypothetical protein
MAGENFKISIDESGDRFINITDAPCNALGDGVHDDSAAIEKAFRFVLANSTDESPIKVEFPRNRVYRCARTIDITLKTPAPLE